MVGTEIPVDWGGGGDYYCTEMLHCHQTDPALRWAVV